MAASGDMMQCRFGSHGDYSIIALCPSSVQEMYLAHGEGVQPGRPVQGTGIPDGRRDYRAHAGTDHDPR